MILQELFESNMSELDIEYQDFLNSRGKNAMSDKEFEQAYGMSRTEWAKRNKEWTWQKERQPVAPDAHLFHEGSQTFGKHEPYWVCVNGKKWKRFETYEHARAVHDRLEKKLRDEGSKKKVSLLADDQLDEKQDACYHKVKSRYKVWPSAYASGALVQCRKKGAANWGNKSKE